MFPNSDYRSPADCLSLVFAQEKPIKYRSTWISVIVGMVFASSASLLLRSMYVRENRRRDALGASAALLPSSQISSGQASGTQTPMGDEKAIYDGHAGPMEETDRFEDKTDRERLRFRYTY